MSKMLKEIENRLAYLYFILEIRKKPLKSQAIYEMAKWWIGKDASPSDIAPDELGCAETVNKIVKEAVGVPIGGEVSTYRMYKALQNKRRFVRVASPIAGDIVISPTGWGNGLIRNGHVGIVSQGRKIMSNDSKTGKWQENYTFDSWKERYKVRGGFPMFFYKVI